MKTFLECLDEAAAITEAHHISAFIKLNLDEIHLIMLQAAADIYASQSNSHKQVVSGKLAYYQLCPKCFGEGQVFNTGATSSLYRNCPVCNGAKTLRVETSLPACASGAGDTATCGVDDNGWQCKMTTEHGGVASQCMNGCVLARNSCEG